jgi:biopolymer transport protein ExbD
MHRQGRRDGATVIGTGPRLGWALSLGAAMLLALAHTAGTTPGVTGTAGPAEASPTLRLQVGTGGSYALDGRPATDIAVERALRDARRQSPGLRLRIDADGDDPDRLIAALALAEHAGIRNVGSRMR